MYVYTYLFGGSKQEIIGTCTISSDEWMIKQVGRKLMEVKYCVFCIFRATNCAHNETTVPS